MDKEIQLDLTNLNSALQSLAELIDVPVLELEIFIYKNLNGEEDLIEKILQRYDVNLNSISIKKLFFKVLHVTTSNDECYEIKKYGLLNLQEAIKQDTYISRYLKAKGIKIDFDNELIIYKDIAYKKEECTDKKLKLCFTKIFSEYHYPINGFLYGDNPLNYAGGIKKRPEIIHNLADIFDCSIEKDWIKNTSCYIIVFKASVYDFDYVTLNLEENYEELCEEINMKIKFELISYIIKLICDLLLNNHSRDKYAYMKKNYKVLPKNIIEIIGVNDF